MTNGNGPLVTYIIFVHRLSPKPEVETPTKLSGVGSGTESLTGATRTVQPLLRSSWMDSLRRMKSTEGTPQQRPLLPSVLCFTEGQPSQTNVIMEAITKRLPLLAFVLAAFAAVAFTSPRGPEYAQDSVDPDIWYDLTLVNPSSTTYECDDADEICTRISPTTSSAMVAEGEFRKIGNLPVYNP